jgi:hypothetical protein
MERLVLEFHKAVLNPWSWHDSRLIFVLSQPSYFISEFLHSHFHIHIFTSTFSHSHFYIHISTFTSPHSHFHNHIFTTIFPCSYFHIHIFTVTLRIRFFTLFFFNSFYSIFSLFQMFFPYNARLLRCHPSVYGLAPEQHFDPSSLCTSNSTRYYFKCSECNKLSLVSNI